ncbi:LysR family transcriptional regulator substrate-binding protein [Nocardia sp. NPDC059240]|uniref:LysR family transcriptional regulator substrate-binding protein n=1 Tax=Nocardia sp. NPDC059240 TaxID=3346786 RepID=UPI0036BF9052
MTVGRTVAGIEFRPVTELPWVLVVHGDDPLADRTTIAPADLADVALIRLPEHSVSRRHLDAALTRLGVRPHSENGATDWNTAVLLAGLGIGHALVPALSYDGGDVCRVPVPFVPPLAVGWATRRWAALPALTHEFAGLVEADI